MKAVVTAGLPNSTMPLYANYTEGLFVGYRSATALSF